MFIVWHMLLHRSWGIALGPIKQVPVNMFIAWHMLSVAEIMGHCPWPHQAGSYEHVHHVDGRQLHLHFPHHDGGDDVLQTYSGHPGHSEQ